MNQTLFAGMNIASGASAGDDETLRCSASCQRRGQLQEVKVHLAGIQPDFGLAQRNEIRPRIFGNRIEPAVAGVGLTDLGAAMGAGVEEGPHHTLAVPAENRPSSREVATDEVVRSLDLGFGEDFSVIPDSGSLRRRVAGSTFHSASPAAGDSRR